VTDPFLRADKDKPRFIAFGQKIRVIPKPSQALSVEPRSWAVKG
jgi:hypothetical protein